MAVQDQSFLDALDKASEGSKKMAGLPDVCQEYQRLKPLINIIVSAIEKIPVWGKKLADFVRRLEALLDAVCPAGGTHGATAPGGRGGH